MDAADEALALARVRAWLRSGKARAVRERAGLSQAEVGRAVGTDMAQVSRWESGFAAPRRGLALKLAAFLGALEELTDEERRCGEAFPSSDLVPAVEHQAGRRVTVTLASEADARAFARWLSRDGAQSAFALWKEQRAAGRAESYEAARVP